MKIGDMIKHRKDGIIGLIVARAKGCLSFDTPPQVAYLVAWSTGITDVSWNG